MTQKDVNFKVKTLLEDLEKDVKANAEDPELMQHASWMRRSRYLYRQLCINSLGCFCVLLS